VKSILCATLLILVMQSAYAASLPGDSTEGKRVHDANCMGCHDTTCGLSLNRTRRLAIVDVPQMTHNGLRSAPDRTELPAAQPGV
jgi:hypothetical protein